MQNKLNPDAQVPVSMLNHSTIILHQKPARDQILSRWMSKKNPSRSTSSHSIIFYVCNYHNYTVPLLQQCSFFSIVHERCPSPVEKLRVRFASRKVHLIASGRNRFFPITNSKLFVQRQVCVCKKEGGGGVV